MVGRGVKGVDGVGAGKMLSCGEVQVCLPLAMRFRKVQSEFFPITDEGRLPIPLLQFIVKYTRLCHAEEGSINDLLGCKRCIPQFCVGYSVGDLLEE